MKISTAIAAAALTLLVAPAFAATQDEDHAAHHPPAVATPETNANDAHEHGDSKGSPLQDKMKQAEALMQEAQQAADPARKRDLLAEHLASLREVVKMMRTQNAGMKMSMMQGGKKDTMKEEGGRKEEQTPKEGAMMKEDGMMKEGGMMKQGGMMKMHKQVEQRLDLLERLLEQMIEHESVEATVR